MKIDRNSIELIRQLRDGKRSIKEIAADLGIAENTVRSRVNKLIDKGVLSIEGLVNTELLAGHSAVFFGVRIANTDLVSKGEEFARLKSVISVSIVTGRYDLMVVVLFNESYGLVDFVTKEVPKIKDVLSTEAFVAYKSWNLKLPYLL